MQSILSIDLTATPAKIQVVQVHGREVEVLESIDVAIQEEGQQIQDASKPLLSHPIFNTNGNAVHLKESLGSLKQQWTTSIVIVPGAEYLSLNLELPFSDQRQVEKIIDLEVQDRVPFEVSEFVVEHRSLDRLPTQQHDIHVSLAPKTYIGNILSLCRAAGIEPLIISTPASVLAALFYLGPDYFKGSCALVYADLHYTYLAVHIDGKLRTDRIIHREYQEPQLLEKELRSLVTQLRLSLCSAEARYPITIEKIYVLGNVLRARDIQHILGREVEDVSLHELIKSSNKDQVCIGSIAAPFAQDNSPPAILTNFRTRDFSYNLQLGEVLQGLYGLLPYFLGLLLCIAMALVSTYYLRERELSSLRGEVTQQIQTLIPSLTIIEGSEADQIQAENAKLDQELESLGSPSQVSPLIIFKEISVAFPNRPNVSLRSISIRGTRVKVTGVAPTVSDVEAVGKAFRNSQTLPLRVKEPQFTNSRYAGSTALEFTFDMVVKE